MKKVQFSPGAREELDAAAERYENDRPGQGRRFYAAVERAARLVARFPEAGPMYRSGEPVVRRIVVRAFPFVIYYGVIGELIYVDAVAHTSREPDYWRRK